LEVISVIKKLLFSLLILSLIAVPLFATACEEEVTPPSGEEEEEEEEEVGNWWDEFGEPQYGGTITVPATSLEVSFDPWIMTAGESQLGYQINCETLFWSDWTLDRNTWPSREGFIPEEYLEGRLAESWEMTDSITLTVHLRQGVLWQDVPPVNGREFVADDVVEHYHRFMGTDGYTEPSAGAANISDIESVTATGKYTVVFKFNQAFNGMMQLIDFSSTNIIEAPEAAALEGGKITNWENCVGTGPWIISDFVSGSSLTFSRNPNYWGTDERHPENQLPYADTLTFLSMPDEATRLAALRSGQVDMSVDMIREGLTGWQQAQSLAETNPELQQAEIPQWGMALIMRCDHAPFNDFRVREALQMSINLPEIAQTYFGGTTDGTPVGSASSLYKGWYYPYDEWPQELKDEYSYNPTLAKQLLAEAAQDGVFEVNEYGGFDTNVVTASTSDLQLLQVVQSYFKDIGVDMEIETMDPAAVFGYCMQGNHDQMFYTFWTGVTFPITMLVSAHMSTGIFNFAHNNDPVYDEIANRFLAATTTEEARQAFYDAEKRALEQHWQVNLLCPSGYIIYQPYLKGYSGEIMSYGQGALFARLWIETSP
jgi:peptide/nickel transport system substrate-binding protein